MTLGIIALILLAVGFMGQAAILQYRLSRLEEEVKQLWESKQSKREVSTPRST